MNVFNFLGYTADVESVLADHGIGVLCSTKKYKEGVSNSILEYMGSDLIAVASDVGATKEIIADKTNGFLFQAEDSISLTNTLRYVIDNWDVMHVIRNHAHETLIEKFDAIANGNRMIEILNEI
jgi:glycosyltransferase involved in cell wall biosynthesis